MLIPILAVSSLFHINLIGLAYNYDAVDSYDT
jgi:hypothetical protein